MKRKSTGKRLRFEVFKRDHFTCQYCGAQPPDIVLVADHIVAVAEGSFLNTLEVGRCAAQAGQVIAKVPQPAIAGATQQPPDADAGMAVVDFEALTLWWRRAADGAAPALLGKQAIVVADVPAVLTHPVDVGVAHPGQLAALALVGSMPPDLLAGLGGVSPSPIAVVLDSAWTAVGVVAGRVRPGHTKVSGGLLDLAAGTRSHIESVTHCETWGQVSPSESEVERHA